MLRVWLVIAAIAAGAPAYAASPGELVTFDRYGALSANVELARRTMTPLTAAELPVRLAALGKGLREQPVDLAVESFWLRLPDRQPAAGYGLLVFVAPWDEAVFPRRWGAVLDDAGMIFVTAARSGNDHDVRGRRMPLALLAAHNVMARYRVDPARIYVSGFSGGARIAERLALAYPDLFRGAILNAGSDPLGGVVAVPRRATCSNASVAAAAWSMRRASLIRSGSAGTPRARTRSARRAWSTSTGTSWPGAATN